MGLYTEIDGGLLSISMLNWKPKSDYKDYSLK